MKVIVENIPEDRLWDIQHKILKVLVKEGFENIDTTTTGNTTSEKVVGVNLIIQK